MSQSVINRGSVKDYALKVSRERRAGKFTRVSEEFLTSVEANVEAAIRQTHPGEFNNLVSPVIPEDNREFITGAALEKIREKLNQRARFIISGMVMRHPTLGCTLKD